jgi:hypothetical protein
MKHLFILSAGIVLAGCGSTLEPGQQADTPEYRIVFTLPSDPSLNVMLGGSGQVRAKVIDRRSHQVTPDEGPTFRSTNPATLTMDAEGHFTAIGWGTGPASIVAEARVGSQRLSKTIGVSVACTAELRVSLNPTSISLGIGETFTPTMSLSTCGGQVPVSTTVTWSASDADILSVNPASGETAGLKSGSASVQGHSAMHHAIVGVIPVTVR